MRLKRERYPLGEVVKMRGAEQARYIRQACLATVRRVDEEDVLKLPAANEDCAEGK